jgi:hypothetical protein
MNCAEFRALIIERIGGELGTEAQPEFTNHEAACAACRAELERWQQMENWLRTGWPSEDPPALPLLPLPRRNASGLELAWRWFSAVSAGLVTASLVALVLLRPSVRLSGTGLDLAFRGTPAGPQLAGQPSSGEQIQNLVQAEVKRAVAEQSARGGAPATLAGEWNEAAARRLGQLDSKVELLGESQSYLWRQVQEQGVDLRSLWRTTASPAAPVGARRPGM